MAEQERLTKAERRAQAREERKRKAEQEAKEARRRRLITTLSSVLVLAVIVAVVATAFVGDDGTIEDAIVLNSSAVEDARAAAGCEVVAEEPLLPPYTHYEATAAPPADQLYTGNRPTNSGPHLSQQHPIVRRGSETQLDERATTHNLEHGSIIAWYDPEQVDGATIEAMEDWSGKLIESGFTVPRAGTGIFVSPYTDPGIESGKAIAFRGWGYSLDCETWDEEVANSVVLDRYGSHGIAPERNFAPFPTEKMRYEDRDATDTSSEDAPIGGRHSGETPAPVGTETDAESSSEPAAEPTADDTATEPAPTETE